jgi:hypothetical protein
MAESKYNPTKMHSVLVRDFDETDLRLICLDLTERLKRTCGDDANDFHYENLKGDNKRATAFTLISRCQQFRILETLAELILDARPHSDITYEEFPPTPDAPKPSNLHGDSRHIMCDRIRQMWQFNRFFVPSHFSHPKLPHAYIVHGDSGQCHSSFVRRLEIEKIRPYAESSKGEFRGTVLHLKPTPPELINDPTILHTDMQIGLFEAVSPDFNPAAMSARDFRAHRELKNYAYIIIEHIWEVSEPSDQLQETIRWYLATYWAEAKADTSGPQILIFLNFVYPNSAPLLLRQFMPSRSLDKERFKEFLRGLRDSVSESYPCLLFDELGHPEQKEICQALNTLGLHDEEDCPEWLKRLYKKKRGKVTMADIEKQLKGPKPVVPVEGTLRRWWPAR